MTKEETKQKLRKSGYVVVDDNSVVTVVISPDIPMKNAIKDIKDKLYSWGYDASFSIRQQKGAEEMVSAEVDILDENEENVNENDIVEAVTSDLVKEDVVQKNIEVDDSKNESESESDDEYFDEEDSDMLLTEDSIQFSLEDFGLDF